MWLARSVSAASRSVSSPFSSSEPTFSSPMDGRGQPEHGAREHVAHHGELDQVARVALHVGAEVQQHHVAARRGADRCHRRAVDAGQRLDDDLGERQQRAGIAGGDHARRLAAGHGIDRDAHRGAAHAQRGGGLGVVADGLGRVPDVADGSGAAMALQQRGELRLVADQQEAGAGVALGGDLQTLDHHERRVIAAHGVNRQCVGRGQGTREATPRPGVRREQRPSAHRRRGRPRARRRSRNGCRRGAGASVRRNWGTRREPRGAAPGGCVACRDGTARSFAWERPWDFAPPVFVTPCGPTGQQAAVTFCQRCERGPVAEGPAGRKGRAGCGELSRTGSSRWRARVRRERCGSPGHCERSEAIPIPRRAAIGITAHARRWSHSAAETSCD